MNKVAIITPVYNMQSFVDESMISVSKLNKGRYEIQHILVDDGSTDDSWNVIQKHLTENAQAFRLEKNMGGSFARNFGVKQTDADLLFCLDADDVIFQNSIIHLADFLRRDGYDWVYGDFLRGNQEMRYEIGQDYYGYDFPGPSTLLTSMLSGEHFFQQNCLYKREVFDQVGGFDEQARHFQDFDLFTRFLLAGRMPQYLSGYLYMHRNHETNLSRMNKRASDPDLHRQDIKNLFSKFEKEIRSKLSEEQLKHVTAYLS